MICPLCSSAPCSCIGADSRREFFICKECGLVFVPKKYHVTVDEERKRYDLHDNTFSNSGYRRFLGEVVTTAIEHAGNGARFLDFGCGKHAVLAGIMKQRGFDCDFYDPLYDFPLKRKTPGKGYGGIIMCEVIEHCRNLRTTLGMVGTLLEDNGTLVLRTRLYPSRECITQWWYAQDVTHITFFSWKSVEKAAALVSASAARTGIEDIFILRKN